MFDPNLFPATPPEREVVIGAFRGACWSDGIIPGVTVRDETDDNYFYLIRPCVYEPRGLEPDKRPGSVWFGYWQLIDGFRLTRYGRISVDGEYVVHQIRFINAFSGETVDHIPVNTVVKVIDLGWLIDFVQECGLDIWDGPPKGKV